MLVETLLVKRAHPRQAYKSLLGILRLDKDYGDKRLEVACEGALSINALFYRLRESILKNGLDKKSLHEKNMLLHPTLDQLNTLRFTGMAAVLNEQLLMALDDINFKEHLGLLLDREIATRETRRMKTRLQAANLRQENSIEDIDFSHPRGLDKYLVTRQAGRDWIRDRNNLIITGLTGVDRTYLAYAFAQKSCCREGLNALYLRTSKLFENLALAKRDGRYLKHLKVFAKADLLVLDDYGLVQLGRDQRYDLLEILEDRHGLKSTLVTSQLPIDHWHESKSVPSNGGRHSGQAGAHRS